MVDARNDERLVAEDGARDKGRDASPLVACAPEARLEAHGEGGAGLFVLRLDCFECRFSVASSILFKLMTLGPAMSVTDKDSRFDVLGVLGCEPLIVGVDLGGDTIPAPALLALAVGGDTELSALSRRFVGKTIFVANSWAPGTGGGTKDEEGEGNGEVEGCESKESDKFGMSTQSQSRA